MSTCFREYHCHVHLFKLCESQFSHFQCTMTNLIHFHNRLSPSKAKAGVSFKAQEIANLVWSFATLNCKATGLVHGFTPAIVNMCSNKNGQYDEKSIARYVKRQEVANIAWSCAVLEEYPKDLMPLLYTGLFGKNCNGIPTNLKRIFADDGIQKQAIMTMFYVSNYSEKTIFHL